MIFKFLRHYLPILLYGFLLIGSLNPSYSAESIIPSIEPWRIYLDQAKGTQLLGDKLNAQRLCQLALSEGEKLKGKERLAFWMSLQEFYELQMDFKARQLILEKILVEQGRFSDTTPKEMIHVSDLLGQNLTKLKTFEKAESCFKLAIKAEEDEFSTISKNLPSFLEHLAELYTLQNKPELVNAINQKKEEVKACSTLCTKADSLFVPYVADLQKTVRAKWTPPRINHNNHTVVSFIVYQNGVIDRIRLKTKSQENETDLSALKAVTLSSPLAPLPITCSNFVSVDFVFDYEIKKKTRRSK